jgi:hypothetical protein
MVGTIRRYGGAMPQYRTLTYVILFTIVLGALPVTAGDGLEVARIAACTGVEEREPIGAAETFPADVGRVWCFTKITGAEDETTILHVWYHKGVERARIQLPVRSKSWRTWSNKTIMPAWTGDWKVVVKDVGGNIIGEVKFTVSANSEPGRDS